MILWDSNFQIRSLKPAFVDAAGFASPRALPPSGSIDLQCDDAVAVVLFKDANQTSNKVTVRTSETPVGTTPIVYDSGLVIIPFSSSLQREVIPLDGKTYIQLVNNEAANRDMYYMFLKTP